MADNWKKFVGVKTANDPLADLKAQLEETIKQKKPQFNRFSMKTNQTSAPRSDDRSAATSRATTTTTQRDPNRLARRQQGNQQRDKSTNNYQQDHRVKNFLKSTGSLSTMFAGGRQKTSSSDESKLFMNLATKFSRDSMDTNNFSEEYDDSQQILRKSKKFKSDFDYRSDNHRPTSNNWNNCKRDKPGEKEPCDRCHEIQPEHLIANEDSEFIYMTLLPMRPILGTFISDVLIRNKDHSCESLVSSSHDHQHDTDKLITVLEDCWKVHGFKLVIIETHLRNRKSNYKNFVSCNQHFEIHCLPVKEKYYERARMNFKQALLTYGEEWSLNRKLIRIDDGRKVYRHLPRGLSYFWVCFGSLDNGFAQIIEDEADFPPNFGLEILCNLLLNKEKDRNATSLNFKRESLEYQINRAKKFKNILRKRHPVDVESSNKSTANPKHSDELSQLQVTHQSSPESHIEPERQLDTNHLRLISNDNDDCSLNKDLE